MSPDELIDKMDIDKESVVDLLNFIATSANQMLGQIEPQPQPSPISVKSTRGAEPPAIKCDCTMKLSADGLSC